MSIIGGKNNTLELISQYGIEDPLQARRAKEEEGRESLWCWQSYHKDNGALAQPVLTQPPSLSSNLGASARLTCTLSSGFNVGNFWIRWYQQKPGNPPRYLLTFHSDSDKHQGSGVPSRFTGSNDASTNAGILLISGLQPEDEADYYCATYHGNSKAFTVLQTHEEVRQKSPHCSALLTKEAWKFLPPPPASGGPSELHRQNLSDIPQSWARDPQVVATSGSEETLAHRSYPLDSPGSLPSSKKALIFESSPVKGRSGHCLLHRVGRGLNEVTDMNSLQCAAQTSCCDHRHH
ncbi:uncharacterized protein [Sagmatias obliquidens]|uniref:uncharacterized protein n=1 Tax=Sagmatias obliquidens TaxID=3371155 RepID=UPI000F43E834|nr:uncharacterized protein LOC113629654 [Lagenorhynchus obliquidens]